MRINFKSALKFTLFIVLCTTFTISKAQVVVENNLSPQELVEQVLLGGGVQVSNLTFNGQSLSTPNNQIGKYIGPSDFIAFDEGIVMATGDVEMVTEGFGGGVDISYTDSDLQLMTGQNIQHAAVLEFDFVPNGDSLVFRYVFASNEYSGFTCSNYNDGFGFFISGPGFNGPYSNNAENIALIPNSDIEVAINTLNSGVASNPSNSSTCAAANPNWIEDSQYFVDNSSEPTGDIQFPGMTTTLTAFAAVSCGQTYHIKMAIGDAMDSGVDSGVFLEAGSFVSNTTVDVLLDIPIGVADSTLYEGCGNATLKFVRPAENTVAETAYLDVSGTAVNGQDYSFIPDSIFFPFGVDTVYVDINAFPDSDIEGVEMVHITVTNISLNCAGSTATSEFQFYINEADPLVVSSFDDSLVDCHDEAVLYPIISGGYGEYEFEWSTGETTDTIIATPGFTSTIEVNVTDVCDAGSFTVPFHVTVPVYDPVVVTLEDDLIINVCDSMLMFNSEVVGGFGSYHYQWFEGSELLGESPFLEYDATNSTQLVLQVTDDCGAMGSDEINITIPPNDVVLEHPGEYVANSCLETILMPAISQGGIGEITYDWHVNGDLKSSSGQLYFEYSPAWGQNVMLTATDECGNFDQAQVVVAFDYPPVVVEASADTTICADGSAVLFGEAVSGSGHYKYQWSASETDEQWLVVNPESSTSYTFTATDTCGMSADTVVRVDIQNINARFEHEYIDYYGVQLTNDSYAENPVFHWDFGDNNISEEENPAHIYMDDDPHTIVLTVTDDIGCTDSASVNVIPPVEVFIPNSFTPNGDGINDTYKIKGEYIEEFKLEIYDRWGKKVFESNDINHSWNGSVNDGKYFAQTSTYHFKLRIKGPNEDDVIEKTGFINLIR